MEEPIHPLEIVTGQLRGFVTGAIEIAPGLVAAAAVLVLTGLPVQVFAREFGESSIDFVVRWWTESTPIGEHRSRDEVVAAIKAALDGAGIEIPFPYRTLTFGTPLSLDNAPDT